MIARLNRSFAFVLTFGLLSLTACEEGQQVDDLGTDTTAMDDMFTADTSASAVAQLEPTEGNEVQGTVRFTEVPGGVRIVADVTGLEEGQHGFHVHENGDCSAPDAQSAGGHFAPQGSPHGAPTDPADQRHVGDLGNIEAGAMGSANYERIDNVISLSGPNSIVGKAVVVHANPDDLESQPSGDAGDRLACGVIEQGAAGQGVGGPAPGGLTPDENSGTM